MFETFLNKEDGHALDLSAFINYNPEQLLFFYYDSRINITLDTYFQMHEWLENCYGNRDNLQKWMDFIQEEIKAGPDLDILQESEFLNFIGPYYYGPTNTQIYFNRFYTLKHEPLTSADISVLFKYHKIPAVDKDLRKYLQTSKTPRKSARSKDDLLRDINVCSSSLKQIEKLNHYRLYLNLFMEGRKAILDAEQIAPREPAPVPQKPDKPPESPGRFRFLNTMGITMGKHQNNLNTDYNRNMKIYYIKCREYEKACGRYKDVLNEWEEYREPFIKKCRTDINDASAKLKQVLALQEIYREVLRKSLIHSDYQNIATLDKFRHYLETGRANDLQGCMNLYEGELHWMEIKASQERIENTIYFLQPDNEDLRLASQEASKLIASAIE